MTRLTPFLFTLLIHLNSLAQEKTIALVIHNQPEQIVKLQLVKGEQLIPLDSGFVENNILKFSMPVNSRTGLYQIDLGKTRSARIMDEASQKLNFIFDQQDVVLELDFKDPVNSVQVMESEENKRWFEFNAHLKMLDNQISLIEEMLNTYEKQNEPDKRNKSATEFNKYQLDRSSYISNFLKNNPDLFACQLASTYQQPLLDGFLNEGERKEEYKEQYFRHIQLTNNALIYSDRYTELVFSYLVLFNDPTFTTAKRTVLYKKALDNMFEKVEISAEVKSFLKEYLIIGFRSLNMPEMVDYIINK